MSDRDKSAATRTPPVTFIRQVIAELRKVVWPTRPMVAQYFVVVLVFVLVMMAIVAGLDFGFGQLMFKIFG
ncbi:preprotein translocase subunit SecE [Aeromicrobium sp. Leaf350]|uniref:preprotein translocase subunit SecE n=1 Tax=Aeromicrobium sp. Leaf350 TaxID=2876565 RepID=UPI001E358A32|nr:preprotein translocase subunit SecE [Aeromicrobium sp. Leaf350]